MPRSAKPTVVTIELIGKKFRRSVARRLPESTVGAPETISKTHEKVRA